MWRNFIKNVLPRTYDIFQVLQEAKFANIVYMIYRWAENT